MRHIKEIHKASRICDKCKKYFKDKHEYYFHLPCKCVCSCGKSFPTQWRFDRHNKGCDIQKSKLLPADQSQSEYQNVISYQCFICGLGDINGDDVRTHIEDFHIHESLSDAVNCEIC